MSLDRRELAISESSTGVLDCNSHPYKFPANVFKGNIIGASKKRIKYIRT